ncbi:hypothetical protein [Streptomyces halstedii]|uniref:hypothetical protein n=1 Tax=Streptomyces halstedii TaxID=1944 RepID=UPI0033BE5125
MRTTSAGWTTGRIVAVVFGGFLSLVALTLIGLGGTALAMGLNDDGYIDLGTDEYSHSTDTYAMTTDSWHADKQMGGLYKDLRITFTPDKDSDPVFVGIADKAKAQQYLDGVQHVTIHDSDSKGDDQSEHPGGTPKTPPGESDVWAAKASGEGAQTVNWSVEPGEVTAVAMKADGSSGLAGHVTVAAKIAGLAWAGAALLVIGLVVLVASIMYLLVRPVRRARGRAA